LRRREILLIARRKKVPARILEKSNAQISAATCPSLLILLSLRGRAASIGCRPLTHRLAFLRAVSTSLHAVVHIADILTAVCTSSANFSASGADNTVQISLAQHEIGRSLAKFGTTQHKPKMFRRCMFAALRQTMRHRRLQTNLLTLTTCVNTCFHSRIGHDRSPERKEKR
jgi:hypothetical protein